MPSEKNSSNPETKEKSGPKFLRPRTTRKPCSLVEALARVFRCQAGLRLEVFLESKKNRRAKCSSEVLLLCVLLLLRVNWGGQKSTVCKKCISTSYSFRCKMAKVDIEVFNNGTGGHRHLTTATSNAEGTRCWCQLVCRVYVEDVSHRHDMRVGIGAPSESARRDCFVMPCHKALHGPHERLPTTECSQLEPARLVTAASSQCSVPL